MEYDLGLGLGQVQGETAFAPVINHEAATLGVHELLVLAPRVAPGRFHLDHFGAQFGQQPAPQRRGDDLGEIGNFYAVKRAGHVGLL